MKRQEMTKDKACNNCGWLHLNYDGDKCPTCGELFSNLSEDKHSELVLKLKEKLKGHLNKLE
jgi:uncharacterized Zn finger protein (UPF0148 family)